MGQQNVDPVTGQNEPAGGRLRRRRERHGAHAAFQKARHIAGFFPPEDFRRQDGLALADQVAGNRAVEIPDPVGGLFVVFDDHELIVDGFVDPGLPGQGIRGDGLARAYLPGRDEDLDFRFLGFLLKLFDIQFARKRLDQVSADTGNGQRQNDNSDNEYFHLSPNFLNWRDVHPTSFPVPPGDGPIPGITVMVRFSVERMALKKSRPHDPDPKKKPQTPFKFKT